MKRIFIIFSALLLTSIGYAQPLSLQTKKAKNAPAITVSQTQTGKHAITGVFKTNETNLKKQLPENAIMVKPVAKTSRSLLDNFLASPAGRGLNLLKTNGSKRVAKMFRFGESVQSIPYTADLTQEDVFNEFLVIDNNEDGRTWGWDTWYDGTYCLYHSSNTADDYLVSPPISLEAGKNYDVIVNAMSAGYNERFEVLVGTEATVDGLSTLVFGPIETSSTDAEDFQGSFVPSAAGNYYVAIHCISDPDQYYLTINQLSVEEGASTNAPAAPTVTATPGENGALTATVVVKAPKNAINGEKLQGNLTKVEVYRDGEKVYEKEDVAPAATFTFVDENLENGTHKYYARAYNAEGPGQKSEEISVYVGVDAPMAPENFASTAQATSILFTWDKVGEVGKNNGYVNPANVDYNLYTAGYYAGWGYYLDEKIATVKDADSYVLDSNPNEGDQGYEYWGLTASNAGGESGGRLTVMLVGKPYDLPLIEGFADSYLHYFWDYDATLLVSSASTDGDDVALALTAEEAGYASFITGKLNLKDAVNPTLMLDVASDTISQFYVVGYVDGGEMEVLGAAPLSENYTTYKIPLTDLVGENYSQVGVIIPVENPTEFDYYGNIETVGDYMLLDNIRIFDDVTDLAIDVKAPATVKAGSSATITATVQNNGYEEISGYTVSIKAGDKILLTETVDEALAGLEKKEFTAELATSIFDEASTIDIVAEVTYDEDVKTENNIAETQISIVESTMPAPENLVAQDKGDASVDLSWNAPSTSVEEVTEDFEDTSVFPTFDIGGITAEEHNGSFGEWKLYDSTGYYVYTWSSSSISYENAQAPCAWQVFDPVQAGFAETSFPPASGTQFLMSMCIMPDTITSQTDHWLISPLLPGIAQTIKFKARALTANYGEETFEVWASTTDNAPENFVLVQDFSTAATTWTEFTADLPEGTLYFAIRHTSTDIFALFLDDITYTKEAAKPTAYNIYYDGELIGTVEGDVTTYTVDQVSDGEHTFAVSAVYDNQESKPVTATITIGGEWLPGDVNHDGFVNVTDVMLTVNYVLTGGTDNFYITEANINGDEAVNVTDVMAIVDIVLNQ